MKNYLFFDENCSLANREKEPRFHTVKADENLRDIARQYYGDEDLWEILKNVNGLVSCDVLEGTEIEIPPI